MKRLFGYWLAMLVLSCASATSHAQSNVQTNAQSNVQSDTQPDAQSALGNEQLDQMLAPVALYPDALLTQVLMASTYPEDVAAAAKWSSERKPPLQGDEAVNAAQDQQWDPSVASLAAFPSVLDMMGREPDWVVSVGDAFLDQPEDVMASVQRLRVEAQKAGNLASNEQQKVATKTEAGNTYITVEPASPDVVYVPSYNPATTYGTWPYPAYPPAYYPPPPGSVFGTALVSGLAFGAGIAIVNSLWGDANWGGNDVDIDVNKYNNINVNRPIDASRKTANWQHNPARRGDVPYRGSGTQQRYNQQRTAALQSQGRGTGQGIGQGTRQGLGQGAGQGLGQGAGQGPGQGLGQGGAGRAGAQPRQAGDQQAKRERAQQVMQERGSGTGQSGRAGTPRAGGDRGAGAGAAGDRRTGAGAGFGAGTGANRPSSPSAAINRDQGQSSAANRGQSREAATSRNQSRDAAYARSRDQNRDNGLRDVNSAPRQFQQASRPASSMQQNRPQQHRAAPRDTGGGRQMDRGGRGGGGGGGGGGGRGGRR